MANDTTLIESLIAERDFELLMERARVTRALERVRHDITQLLEATRAPRNHEIRPLIHALTEAHEAVAGIEAIAPVLAGLKKQIEKEKQT